MFDIVLRIFLFSYLAYLIDCCFLNIYKKKIDLNGMEFKNRFQISMKKFILFILLANHFSCIDISLSMYIIFSLRLSFLIISLIFYINNKLSNLIVINLFLYILIYCMYIRIETILHCKYSSGSSLISLSALHLFLWKCCCAILLNVAFRLHHPLRQTYILLFLCKQCIFFFF